MYWYSALCSSIISVYEWSSEQLSIPESKVHGANMGPTWALSAQDGPHVGPMNLTIMDGMCKCSLRQDQSALNNSIANFHWLWLDWILSWYLLWDTRRMMNFRTNNPWNHLLSDICVPETGFKDRDKQLHPTYTVGCNYFSSPLIADFGNGFLHAFVGFRQIIQTSHAEFFYANIR